MRRLIAIVGKRAFWSFGAVTFVVAALLASVNIASRHAIKVYVEDQLDRIPWDLAIYNTGGFTLTSEYWEQVRSVDGLKQVESLALLRARLPQAGEVVSEVDGKPFTTPWLSLVAASDPDLLPPELSLALQGLQQGSENRAFESDSGAILALVGPERAMAGAFMALQGARQFTIRVERGDQSLSLFDIPLQGVIRMERDEMNRWLMDQLGSISFIPHIGAMLLMPYQDEVLRRFDSVATGFVPLDLMDQMESDLAHVQRAQYMPEVSYVARIDQQRLISGWDIETSLQNLRLLIGRTQAALDTVGPGLVVDSTTLVLLERISRIARLIVLISLLIAMPLLWIAWLFAGNLSGLLMLNERRILGLMRLRGIPGKLIGRSFLVAISLGGVLGGTLGLLAGSVIPLLLYEKGSLPVGVLTERGQFLASLSFLVLTLVLALVTSQRLVRFATTISPLEASHKVSRLEASKAGVRFGGAQFLCLVLGGYALSSWILGFSISGLLDWSPLAVADQLLAFVGLPFFIYGVVTLLVSRRKWVQILFGLVMRPVGGGLGTFAVKHSAAKAHRSMAFLLIVALVASVSMYPTVTSGSFEDKGQRGARVQMGSQSLVTLNAPDLAGVEQLRGGLGSQLEALRPGIQNVLKGVGGVDGVQSVTFLLEGVLPNFFLPNYGLRGVPIFLIGDVNDYLNAVYAEPELGLTGRFEDLVASLKREKVLASPPVADFWRVSAGSEVPLGMDEERRTISALAGGVLAFLPGTPSRTVTDRQGFVQARVDYLNHLFSQNAYLVAAADNPILSELMILIPRVVLLVNTTEGASMDAVQAGIARALPFPPLEMNDLSGELKKIGSDMFISLALENMRIYLVGGLFLALIAILSVATVNYTEDRQTVALLRIRGASLMQVWRVFVAFLLAPGLLGLILGGGLSLLGGFGLANLIWNLREIKTAVQLLPTRLVVPPLAGLIVLLVLAMLLGVAFFFSYWVFRRTARETVGGN